MRSRLLVFVVAVPLVLLLGASICEARATGPELPGRVIVKFKDGTSVSASRETAARSHAQVQRRISRSWAKEASRMVVLRSATLTTPELVKVLKADPNVAYAEPDYVLRADGTPNDLRWGELWGMAQISAPSAWNVSTGSPQVVIADVDTGVDYTHPDLAANMWRNPGEVAGNAIDDDGNGYVDDVYGIDPSNGDSDPMDDDGHGTHTSGSAAAVGGNGVGVAGVCWTAQIMALKFLGADGSGYTSDAIACIDYVIDEKLNHGVNVVVVNASWGGGSYSTSLRDAIVAAGSAGIVFVAAAGNEASNNDASPSFPASYDCPNIIAVAASTSTDALASFSNYGAASVDLAAPGVGILSTVPTALSASGYASWNGSSMATPHVSGAIALCAAVYPAESAAQRVSRILNGADPVSALAGRCVTGGRLNLARAVGAAPAPVPVPVPVPVPDPPDTTPPVTVASGYDDAWHNRDVPIYLSATDDRAGVDLTWGAINQAAYRVISPLSEPLVVPASKDHTNDGAATIWFRSVDKAGNLEAWKSCTVNIDTSPPVGRATAATVVAGRVVRLKFRVNDALPGCGKVAVKIQILKRARVLRTITVGKRTANVALTYRYRARLKRGTYSWRVLATDVAGNVATSAATAKLTLR